MNQKNLQKYIGSMQQLAYVRPVTYEEGRSTGLKAYQVKNGPLSLNVLGGKCLDVTDCTFKGININFLSKPGLQGRNHYDTNGDEALRSIMGGLFFTSGLENICAPCTLGGKNYPMHGRIRTTPGEHLSADASWIEGKYVISVSGEMREAELFGENMVLRRKIESEYGSNSFTVTDAITNESFLKQPLMLLYHINMGYPFLTEDTKLYIPTKKVTPRDEAAKGHEGRYDVMDPPKDNEPEYVFIHDLKKDRKGRETVLVVNPKLEIGLKLEWNTENLPFFMEWKSTASGDYVIGLEPANSSVYGRPYAEKNHSLHYLEPFQTENNQLKFTFLDGNQEIVREEAAFKKAYQSGKKSNGGK